MRNCAFGVFSELEIVSSVQLMCFMLVEVVSECLSPSPICASSKSILCSFVTANYNRT